MSEKRFCPECNSPLNGDELFCDNCGAELSAPAKKEEKSPAEVNSGVPTGKKQADGEDISRNNVMGSINKTTNTTTNTSNSLTKNSVDNSVSNVSNTLSKVDNSTKTVNNNTTIVMGGKGESEFCQVCGNPIDEKHARCPKCGKSICFDCKVQGKNRCIECEKKAGSEYRMAFQELLFTTQGNIGIAGRQMMNRKAEELDVEDKKKAIEDELIAVYKEQTKAQQPTIIPTAPTAPSKPETKPEVRPQANVNNEKEKGVGALNGRTPLSATSAAQSSKNNSNSGGSKPWIIIVAGVAVILLAYVLLGGNENKQTEPQQPVQEQTVTKKEPAAQEPKQPATEKKQETVSKPEEKTTSPAAEPKAEPKAAPKADPKYDEGMKAYESGDGIKALASFKASGSAQSLYMIGVIYENGCGNVAKNAMMARQNFKKAAQMGSEEAKARL
jgi:predicted amidophosphoribosyltransferase